MTYGYYLAETKTEHGDPVFSRSCRERWETLGLEKPQRFDGCSAWVDADGSRQVRILCRDFFSPSFKVAQAMVTR